MNVVFLSQWLLYIVSLVWRIPTRITYDGLENLNGTKRPFILASNHGNRVDPFFLSLLPYATVKELIPLRFPTASLYFDQILYRCFIAPLGSFRMERWSTSLDEYMRESVNILNQGGAILIFPEGKIIRSEKDRVAKPGLAYLAKKTNAPIIPMRVELVSKGSLFKRSVVRLSFGEVILLQDGDFSKEILTKESQEVLDVIYSLE